MIGESCYIEAVSLGNGMAYGGATANNKGEILVRGLFELRTASLEIWPNPISDADRLNGIEWEGTLKLNSGAVRCYIREGGFDVTVRRQAPDKDKKWSEWKSNGREGFFLQVNAKKVNGNWERRSSAPSGLYDALFGFGDNGFTKVNVSDVPK